MQKVVVLYNRALHGTDCNVDAHAHAHIQYSCFIPDCVVPRLCVHMYCTLTVTTVVS